MGETHSRGDLFLYIGPPASTATAQTESNFRTSLIQRGANSRSQFDKRHLTLRPQGERGVEVEGEGGRGGGVGREGRVTILVLMFKSVCCLHRQWWHLKSHRPRLERDDFGNTCLFM